MQNKLAAHSSKFFLIVLAAVLLISGGCGTIMPTDSATDGGHASDNTAPAKPEFEPYSLTDFRDLIIPGELTWVREKSVTLNTDSFKGGVLNFNGRVEVTSLMDFFDTSMKNDGWSSVGSIKSKDVLLTFTKENSSCIIRIMEGGALGKTEVNIYIANTAN